MSIVLAATGESQLVADTVRSLTLLEFPTFEIIVAVDSSAGEALERLTAIFDLEELPPLFAQRIRTEPLRRLLGSRSHPNLLVVEKQGTGMADALNAALNLAQCPVVCPIEVGSGLDAFALLRASMLFASDEHVTAIAGGALPVDKSSGTPPRLAASTSVANAPSKRHARDCPLARAPSVRGVREGLPYGQRGMGWLPRAPGCRLSLRPLSSRDPVGGGGIPVERD